MTTGHQVPRTENQLLKQPVIALVTLIAWVWLAVSIGRASEHWLAVAKAALAHFFVN
jgi:hypothetical protein